MGTALGHFYPNRGAQYKRGIVWAQVGSVGQPSLAQMMQFLRLMRGCCSRSALGSYRDASCTAIAPTQNPAVTLLTARLPRLLQNRSTPEMSGSMTALVGLCFSFLMTEAFMQTYLRWHTSHLAGRA